ncbi:MAG: helicase-exonuclease AddAB subunit AddA [Lachnospiraceae bacterium]|nr:helicase-exonuclease AddAB subunit AddA [Lachnospiraceae bacterium]
MEWTKHQQQVIQLHQRDLLVSAAAGSGKTAVLVERIIQMILDEANPVDIDRILVVTFTRAAAKEMKERIFEAIQKAVKAHPDNHHLLRQMTLIHNAQISTIDSFCSSLVRQHFGEIDLDPDYRMADTGELELLMSGVWDEVLEANYEVASTEFLHLVNCYAKRDRDDQLVEAMRHIYLMSQAYPWPSEWLAHLLDPYQVDSLEALEASSWMQQWRTNLAEELGRLQQEAEALLRDLREVAGDDVHPYEDALQGDLRIIDHLSQATTATELVEQIGTMPEFTRLSTKKFEKQDPEEREACKLRRNRIKDGITHLIEAFGGKTSESILLEMQDLRGIVTEMIRLINQFDAAFTAKKRSLGILDFSDIEHCALDILVDATTKELRPVAKELAAYYEEVMVDEYQDSNHLQETILYSISKDCLGAHNYFMVGDVKQSIYRFRQAEPQIFNGKYHAFSPTESEQQRIDLDQNFRSRNNIIETVNDVFRYIMKPDMGGVDYDDAASLKLGASYPESTSDLSTEVQIVIKDDPLFAEEELSGEEAEFVFIAQHINAWMQAGMEVYDKKLNAMRPLQYRDVAVLRRGLSGGVGERLVEILDAYRIPAHLESSTGYFNTLEVEVILSFLRILDNPRQEVPLVSVLRSPMVGLCDEDLANIRVEFPKVAFQEAVAAYTEAHPEHAALQKFSRLYEYLRGLTVDTPIHRIIQILYEKSGYLRYVQALPSGATRRANLEKLVDMAISYEATSFQGLFHFVNYIEKLKKYQVDFGEADLVSDEDNAVRVMTIHKSKGLEFPVVILSGATKQFNTSDLKGDVLLHASMGVGLYHIDPLRRVKDTTLYRTLLSDTIALDNLGEELRVLYVALTRAKEKLMITGCMNQKDLESLTLKEVGAGESFYERKTAKCYLEWMLPAILHHPGKYQIQTVESAHLVSGAVAGELMDTILREQLVARSANADSDYVTEITRGFVHTYGHPRQTGCKIKYSVSELKHQAIEEAMADGLLPEHEESESQPMFGTDVIKRVVPAFISGEETDGVYIGALRGTAMHRYMECFDFVRENAGESYEVQLDEMVASGKVTKEQEALLRPGQLVKFLQSDIAGRMMSAAVAGNLYKERAFVMGDTPAHFFANDVGNPSDEQMVLVQGIIDVFFKEEDGIVLLDYKTDRVDSGEELVVRYKRQMELYADAIMRTQGMPVKEMYLYSFALGETLLVE